MHQSGDLIGVDFQGNACICFSLVALRLRILNLCDIITKTIWRDKKLVYEISAQEVCTVGVLLSEVLKKRYV